MARPSPSRPTDAELEILNVLYTRGPSTVRDVYETISENRQTLYTSVLKMMQIMLEKELLVRDETARAHSYAPRLSQEQTRRQLIDDLLERAFGGSATKLVMQVLSATKRTSPEELSEIKALLDGMEKKRK